MNKVDKQLKQFLQQESKIRQDCSQSSQSRGLSGDLNSTKAKDCTQRRLEETVEHLLTYIDKVDAQKRELADRVKDMHPVVRIQANNYNTNYNAYLKDEVR